MSSCIDPGTRSPGKLNVIYNRVSPAVRHVTGWHLIVGADPYNIASMQAEADAMAIALAPCLTNINTITDWEVRLPNGVLLYTAPLTVPHIGSHSLAANALGWASQTLELGGKAPPLIAGGCSGRVRQTVFHGGAVPPVVGAKTFDTQPDGGWRGYVTYVNASLLLPADFYGIQASISTIGHVQWNAHAQRKDGN